MLLTLTAKCLLLALAVLDPKIDGLAIEVTPVAGEVFRARLVELGQQEVVFERNGARESLPLNELLQLRWPTTQSSLKAKIEVQLIDGTRLSGKELASQEDSSGADRLVIVLLNDRQVQISQRQIEWCQLQSLSEALTKQWDELIASKASADVLILKRSDDALDKIEGVVTKITDKAVSFELDGRTVDVSITKLAGLRLFNANPKLDKLRLVVNDTGRNKWNVSSISLPSNSESLELVLQCGEKVSLPLSLLREIDYSVASLVYFANLEPLERTSSQFDLVNEIPGTEKLFGPRVASKNSHDIEFLGTGSLTYRIPDGCKRVVGSVELAPRGDKFTACEVSLVQENKLLWKHEFTKSHEPVSMDVAVEPNQRLRLLVESSSSFPVGDVVRWQNVRLLKSP